jgi:lipid A 4'-phosphatase
MTHLFSLRTIGILFLGLSLFFYLFPSVDIFVSNLFYTSQDGFFLKKSFPIVLLRNSVDVVTITFLIFSLWLIAVGVRSKDQQTRRKGIYLIAVLLLGPGLLVNAVLKNHWDRARPTQTTEFGGDCSFTPAWQISDQCQTNCSFVCGDCSVGFALIALAFAFPAYRRKLALLALTLGSLYSFVRIAQGGHFFSDAILSFFVIYLVATAASPLLAVKQSK